MNNYIKNARQTLIIESQAIKDQLKHLDRNFKSAIDIIASCSGRVVVMGLGKSGIIARKIAATMSSLGVPSVFLHPAECLHGDLGMLMSNDIILALSYSGETVEFKKALPLIKNMGLRIVVFTGRPQAKTWLCADYIINTKISKEACPHNLAPTASTTAMLALGDALAICASEKKGFKKEHFARYHPDGSLGKKITIRVKDLMHKGSKNPLIRENKSVNDALAIMTKTTLGAVSVIDKNGVLLGFFTDGDLRRKLQKDKSLLNKKIKDVMTKSPMTINPDTLAIDAAKILEKRSFDNIPVVDNNGKPVGIIDERDLMLEGIV